MLPFHLNWFTRYSFVVDVIRNRGLDGGRILEVGSGSFGLALFIGKRVIGLDTSFDRETHELLAPIRGRAGLLPFEDRSFDLVVSLDLVEHVPPADRPRLIAEMYRVCGSHLVIGCPIGQTAVECDRRFANWLGRNGKDLPLWLAEHLETDMPQEQEIVSIIESLLGAAVEVFPNENAAAHTMAIIADHTPEVLDSLRPSLNAHLEEWLEVCRRVNFGDCYRKFFVVERSE